MCDWSKWAEGAVKGVLSFFADHYREVRMMLHFPRTINKWKEEGTYPALLESRLSFDPISWSGTRLFIRLDIHLTARVKFHLARLSVKKEGKLTRNSFFVDGLTNSNVYPQIEVDYDPDYGPPPNKKESVVTINSFVSHIYHVSNAKFLVPYSSNESIRIQTIAHTYDMNGEAYNLYSPWMTVR